jgi:uncharacterized Ntn-hydrolase superfamily protein
MFAVGAAVPWARAGIGAVATQAIAEPAYGPRCLDALAAGKPAQEALTSAATLDPMSALRQVGVVGADGSVAAATGELCIQHAGHIIGDGFVVQANMAADTRVWPAMAEAFAASSGQLARRLLSALAAAGGDARGRMAAALLVVDAEPPSTGGDGTVVNLRVDRSSDPLGELGTLLDAAEAYAGFSRAVDLLYGGDPTAALTTIDDALTRLPGEANFRFLRSGALAASGDAAAAGSELRALVAQHATWQTVVEGFVDKGLLVLPDGMATHDLLGLSG